MSFFAEIDDFPRPSSRNECVQQTLGKLGPDQQMANFEVNGQFRNLTIRRFGFSHFGG